MTLIGGDPAQLAQERRDPGTPEIGRSGDQEIGKAGDYRGFPQMNADLIEAAGRMLPHGEVITSPVDVATGAAAG